MVGALRLQREERERQTYVLGMSLLSSETCGIVGWGALRQHRAEHHMCWSSSRRGHSFVVWRPSTSVEGCRGGVKILGGGERGFPRRQRVERLCHGIWEPVCGAQSGLRGEIGGERECV